MSATALHPPTNPLLPLAVLTGAIVAVAAGVVAQPGILANNSPSEPPGLYSRTTLAPATGRLIAFHAPLAAFPYADRRLAYLHHTPILKAVAAAPGDRVCTRSGRLVINGADRAPIAMQARAGHPLPRGIDCARRVRCGLSCAPSPSQRAPDARSACGRAPGR